MKIDKNKYCAYFTNLDQEQISPLITTLSEREVDKYITVMKKYYTNKINKWFVLIITVSIILDCITCFLIQNREQDTFGICIAIGLFTWLVLPFNLLQDEKITNSLIIKSKMFYISVNAKERIEYIVEFSHNKRYFYPVLGTINDGYGYTSIWYVPEWLYKTCKEGDIIPCWLQGA